MKLYERLCIEVSEDRGEISTIPLHSRSRRQTQEPVVARDLGSDSPSARQD
jgi:hypothetical protein